MPAPDRHPTAELHELLAGSLGASASAQVEQHLAQCEQCRRALEALRATREFAAAHFAAPPAPPELRARILAALAAESAAANAESAVSAPANIIPLPARTSPRRWPWIAAAALLVLAAIAALTFLRPRPALPAVMAAAFREHHAQRLPLGLATGDMGKMEAWFTANGVPFRTRVFDLGMMKFQLTGGLVRRELGQPSALFTYRGPGDRVLLCEMFAGKMSALPAGAEVREHNGFRFQIYRQGEVTTVFWAEGAIICVLASDAPPEEVTQLAFAKAMAP